MERHLRDPGLFVAVGVLDRGRGGTGACRRLRSDSICAHLFAELFRWQGVDRHECSAGAAIERTQEMTEAQEKVAKIQEMLGFSGSDVDGVPGRKTKQGTAALFDLANSQADGWAFSIRVDGGDLVCDHTSASWFGGDNDPLDNGETASGVMTKGNPDLLGCALPVLPQVRSTAGSPLPRLPWKIPVVVTAFGQTITVPLIDNGPAKSARDGIDLTVAAFKSFGVTLKQGIIPHVSFRVIDGAQYLIGNGLQNGVT